MLYPLVRELAAENIPFAVTCRVLGFSTQAFYKWRANPVSQRDWDDAHLIDAAYDIRRDDPAFGYRFIARQTARTGLHSRGEPGGAVVLAATDLVGLRQEARADPRVRALIAAIRRVHRRAHRATPRPRTLGPSIGGTDQWSSAASPGSPAATGECPSAACSRTTPGCTCAAAINLRRLLALGRISTDRHWALAS